MNFGALTAKIYTRAEPPVLQRTITTVYSGGCTYPKNGAGNGQANFPAMLSSADRNEIQKGRICVLSAYSEVAGADLEVACFVINKIDITLTSNGVTLNISGPDLMNELGGIPIDQVISEETSFTSTAGSITSAWVDSPPLTSAAWVGYTIRTEDNQHYGVVSGNNTALITLENEWTNGEPSWPEDIIFFGVDPTTDDVTDLLDNASDWDSNIQGGGNGTQNGTLNTFKEESLLEALNKTAEQSGEFFRLDSLTADRTLEWRQSADSTGITLVMPNPSNPTAYEDDDEYGILTALKQVDNYEVVTRVHAYGAGLGDGRLTLQHANISLPAGFDWITNANGHKIGIKNTSLESGGNIQRGKEKTWAQIQPAAETSEAIQTAANALANSALNWLQRRSASEYQYEATCIVHANLRPGDRIELNHTVNGQNPISMVHTGGDALYIQSIRHNVNKSDGIRYTSMTLTESQHSQSESEISVVAENIQDTRAIQRHTSSSSSSAGGAVLAADDHGSLNGLLDDDHTIYLLADGSRELSGNLSVANGVTIDGVDISAHAADADAHHDEIHDLLSHAASGLTADMVLKATGSSTYGFDYVDHDELTGVGADDHHNQVHGITSSDHTVAGSVLDLVGLTGTNQLGILSPESDPSGTAILKTGVDGELGVNYLGINVAPDTAGDDRLKVDGDIRLLNDNRSISSNSTHNITLSPGGDLILNPGEDDIFPGQNYTVNIGGVLNKFLTLHVAELIAQTLVAEDVISTIGGQLIVAPTTELTADIDDTTTTITVKHNNLSSGDRIRLEARLQVEFMAVTSGATPNGDAYDYTVTRNLDGSGANSWIAGDGVINTRQAGDGYIHLYSASGLGTAGPTIAGVVRKSSTYNDVDAAWALGNLNGLYGYGADTYGVGLGDEDNAHLTIDPTNGIRMFNEFGERVGLWEPGGDVIIGEVATGQANFQWDQSAGRVNLRGGTSGTEIKVYLDSDGTIVAGGGDVVLDDEGISLAVGSGASSQILWKQDPKAAGSYAGIYSSYLSGTVSTYLVNYAGTRHNMQLTAGGVGLLLYQNHSTYGQRIHLSTGLGFASIRNGLTVGMDLMDAVDPGDGILYVDNLISRKGSTNYDVYGYHPLTSHNYYWSGASLSGNSTYSALLSTWGLPADCKALSLQFAILPAAAGRMRAGYSSSDPNDIDHQGSSGWNRFNGICNVNSDRIYFRIDVAGTHTVYMKCSGYWI